MVRSMTGYGSFRGEIDGYSVSAEVKSVNHRYLEFSVHIPRSLSFVEDKLRALTATFAERGKIDCYIQLERIDGNDESVVVNNTLAREYFDAAASLAASLGIDGIKNVREVLTFPDVITVERRELDEEAVTAVVTKALSIALTSFVGMRETEGVKLREDILSRKNTILGHVEYIESRSPQTVAEYEQRLLAKMRAAIEGCSPDEQRVLTEAAIFADKVAVAEETVRLRSHMEQLQTLMDANTPTGKKLDFLVQEMNREANTIGSKAQDVEIARRVIEIKAEIEKIREQVQNIE